METIFTILNAINVNEHTEEKNGLTYLSWAWAWAEVKKAFPAATYTIYERQHPELGAINYFTDGMTCWVKTGVTINGQEHIEMLPVMDYKNKSIPADKVTSFDVNKSIQRSLTKACARHGLGLYIYAGEDLPEGEEKEENNPKKKKNKDYDEYWKWVAAQAEGKLTPSGKSAQMAWTERYHPSLEQLDKFCADVDNYKRAKGIN